MLNRIVIYFICSYLSNTMLNSMRSTSSLHWFQPNWSCTILMSRALHIRNNMRPDSANTYSVSKTPITIVLKLYKHNSRSTWSFWGGYKLKEKQNPNYNCWIYWSKTTYVFLGNTAILILPNLLRGWDAGVGWTAAAEPNASDDVVLLKLALGLEERDGWEVPTDGGLGSFTLTLNFLSLALKALSIAGVGWDGAVGWHWGVVWDGGVGWGGGVGWDGGVGWGGGVAWTAGVGWDVGWTVGVGWDAIVGWTAGVG